MKLIIGLGNPGKKYALNRHNAGFIILDELRKAWDFPEFEMNKKFNAEISEGIKKTKLSDSEGLAFGTDHKTLLIKPATFMNLSGTAVKSILDFYKLSPEDITVIHDDLDINIGEYKVSSDNSAAGHNGVQSIFDNLGTQQIKRIRVGIEGAKKRSGRLIPGDVFVLQDFSETELETIKNLAKEITTVL